MRVKKGKHAGTLGQETGVCALPVAAFGWTVQLSFESLTAAQLSRGGGFDLAQMARGHQHRCEQRLYNHQEQVNTLWHKAAVCASTGPLIGHMALHLAHVPCAYALSGSDMRPPT